MFIQCTYLRRGAALTRSKFHHPPRKAQRLVHRGASCSMRSCQPRESAVCRWLVASFICAGAGTGTVANQAAARLEIQQTFPPPCFHRLPGGLHRYKEHSQVESRKAAFAKPRKLCCASAPTHNRGYRRTRIIYCCLKLVRGAEQAGPLQCVQPRRHSASKRICCGIRMIEEFC